MNFPTSFFSEAALSIKVYSPHHFLSSCSVVNMSLMSSKHTTNNRDYTLAAMKHSLKSAQYRCRKLCGVQEAFVCDTHDKRCVICDVFTDEQYANSSSIAKVCDECAFQKDAKQTQRCVLCDHLNAQHVARYCRYCMMLEKDRDGCPKVLGSNVHQHSAHLKSGDATLQTN